MFALTVIVSRTISVVTRRVVIVAVVAISTIAIALVAISLVPVVSIALVPALALTWNTKCTWVWSKLQYHPTREVPHYILIPITTKPCCQRWPSLLAFTRSYRFRTNKQENPERKRVIIFIYLHGPCLLGLHSHLHALFRTAAAGTPPLAEQFSAHTKRDIHTENPFLYVAFKTKLTLKPPCNIYKKHLQLKCDPLPMCIQRKLKVVNFKNILSINSGFNYWLGQISVCNKLICSGLISLTLSLFTKTDDRWGCTVHQVAD